MTDWKFIYNRYVHRVRECDGLRWDWRGSMNHDEPFLNPFILEKHKTFIDVGANVGAWSIRASPFYEKVVAFEPNKKYFRSFLRNLEMNNITNVMPWNYGISDRNGSSRERVLPAIGKDDIQAGLFGEDFVPVRTLDGMFIMNEDAVLKIDTEGAGYRIIRGGLLSIRKYHPRIILEVHSEEERKVPGLLPDYAWRKMGRVTDSWVWKENGQQVFLIGQ